MADSHDKRCLKILELLPRFIENDFSPEESEEIRVHLEQCPSCQAEYESMRQLMDTLETVPTRTVPASFQEAVMRPIPKPPEKKEP